MPHPYEDPLRYQRPAAPRLAGGGRAVTIDTGNTYGPLTRADVAAIERDLKPCPFCGGKGHLRNTHSASYWIECGRQSCAAEVHGTCAADSASGLRDDHLAAAQSAGRRWNRRRV